MTKMRSSVKLSNQSTLKKKIRKTELNLWIPAKMGIQKCNQLHPDVHSETETTHWTRYTSEKTSMSWVEKVLQ